MSNWSSASLGDLFDIARGGSPRPIDAYLTDADDGVNWVSISDATSSDKYIRNTRRKIKPSGVSRSRAVQPGDFLLTNSMSFGRPYIMATSGCIHDGWLSLSPKSAITDPDYLFQVLSSQDTYEKFARLAAGATVKNLNIDLVKRVEIPLPPIDEQRRIAAILDQADALRRKRREALAKLTRLVEAMFNEMFGSAQPDGSNWPRVKFEKLLAEPLRNGVSPSADGTVSSSILTLAAVTGARFDEQAVKVGSFKSTPPSGQRVRLDDFLICRGNGNAELVGRGLFPIRDLPDTVFPDTIIAGRINRDRVDPVFLEFVWNTPETRRQINTVARTTNGTFKVNQTMLERIELIDPPLKLQRLFASRASAVKKIRAIAEKEAARVNALFASLQHRAFAGEL